MNTVNIEGKATLICGDCLGAMAGMAVGSVDAIITNLPYGTTACKWDVVIPFVPMWAEVKRILKPHGVFVTTASQPFTSMLVMSNLAWFKYEWIWEKDGGSNFATVKYMPMKEHENILVFSGGTTRYNAQSQERIGSRKGKETTSTYNKPSEVYGRITPRGKFNVSRLRCPRSIQRFQRERGLHPTQKPVALYVYLINTYTTPGDTVLDFCMGSGTTGVACMKTGRKFVGVELNEDYFNIAVRRIQDTAMQPLLL